MKRRLLWIAALLVMFLTAASAPPLRAQTPSATEVAADARRQQADVAFAEAERNLTVRLLDKCLAQADADSTLLTGTRAKAEGLAKRMNDLRTNDDGKRLAAGLDIASARQVQRLIDEPVVTVEILKRIEGQLQAATEELKKRRSNPPAGFVPPDSEQDEMNSIAVTLRAYQARVIERTNWLESMMSSVPRNLDLSKTPTLEAALIDFRRREQQAWNDAQRAGIEQAQPVAREQITAAARAAELERSLEQARQLLADTRAELERLRLEDDMRLAQMREEVRLREDALKLQLAESQATRVVRSAQVDTKVAQAQQDAEMIRKRQEARRPEILTTLSMFTTPGYLQPGSPMPSDKRQPMSLDAIRGTGALVPGQDGLKALFNLGSEHLKPLRVRWPFRTYNDNFTRTINNPASHEQLQKIQDYLNEYGEALVAEGLLSR